MILLEVCTYPLILSEGPKIKYLESSLGSNEIANYLFGEKIKTRRRTSFYHHFFNFLPSIVLILPLRCDFDHFEFHSKVRYRLKYKTGCF